MRRYKNKSQLLALFLMFGFLIGILYANMIPREYLTSSGIFNEYFLKEFAHTEIITEDYVWYIVRSRMFPFLLLCLLSCIQWKKILVGICVAWTGFSAGILSVAAILSIGMKGIFLCAAGVFPQIFFYIFAYMIVLWYLYHYPQGKWNAKKTTITVLAMSLGIAMEVYVNPIVVRGIVGIF